MGTPDELKVPLQMLGHDARKWNECGTQLSQAAQQGRPLRLTDRDFGFLGVNAGLPSYYEELRLRTTTILGGGSEFCNVVAGKLRTLRTEFATDDQEACDLIRRSAN